MGRIVAITNQKDGVGKVTTTISLFACLAETGQKVLLVDFDSQGNTTSGVGLEKGYIDKTVYELLVDECQTEECLVKEVQKNLGVLPSGVDLVGAEIELLDLEDKELLLKQQLNKIKGDYDYILINCPPALGLLIINALIVANTVLVPIQCEYHALEGLSRVLKTVGLVYKKLNPNLGIESVVFTIYDAWASPSLEAVGSVKSTSSQNIYKTIILRDVRLAEAPSHRIPINSYDSRSTGAEGYRLLATEVMNRGEDTQWQNEQDQGRGLEQSLGEI